MCQTYSKYINLIQSRYRQSHTLQAYPSRWFLGSNPVCVWSTAINFRKCVNRFHDVSRVLIARVRQQFPVLSALTVLKMGICLNLTNADAKLFGKHLKHARELLNDIIVKAAIKHFNNYESLGVYATIVDLRMMLLTWLLGKDCKD